MGGWKKRKESKLPPCTSIREGFARHSSFRSYMGRVLEEMVFRHNHHNHHSPTSPSFTCLTGLWSTWQKRRRFHLPSTTLMFFGAACIERAERVRKLVPFHSLSFPFPLSPVQFCRRLGRSDCLLGRSDCRASLLRRRCFHCSSHYYCLRPRCCCWEGSSYQGLRQIWPMRAC